MGVITALEVQKKNKQRVNVYLDGEFAFGLSLMDAARLRKGQTLTDAEIAALRDEDAVIQAVDRAARFLAYRPRSIYEVRQNLEKKDTSPAVIEAALNRLTDMGYLDDTAFARYWVQNRNEFKPLSPKALRFELRKKGVLPAIISEVLDELEGDELAYRAAQGRANRLRGVHRSEFRQKMAAFLQQRGFTYSTIRDVVERLMEDMEAQDPEYFTTDEE
jgi:regulatory protein